MTEFAVRPLRIVLGALLVLAAVAGCGNDPAPEADLGDGNDTAADADTDSDTDSDADEDAAGADEEEAEGDGPASSDADEGEQAAALLGQGRSPSFHAVFEVTDPAAGDLHHVVAQDPPKFSSWQSDAEDEDGRTYAQHLIAQPEGTVVACIWLGDVDDEDIDEWECAREQPPSDGGSLFEAVFGGMLFDSEDYSIDEVATAGWDPSEPTEIVGRPAVCGSSPAFAEAVAETCIDAELGIPLAVERDDASGTVVEFRDPVDGDFAPPAEPWDSSDAND